MWCLPLLLGVAHGVTTSFKTEGRKILIQTPDSKWEVFKIRGFSYSNARIGEDAPTDTSPTSYDALMRPELCKRDFDAMRKLNTNAIKVYAYNVLVSNSRALHQQCLDYAWNDGYKPIFLDLSIWVDSLPMGNIYKQNIISRYEQMVKDTASHPAVFAYGIGSEFAGDPNCAPSFDVSNCQYWKDFNAIASAVRQAMAGSMKLITTATYQSSCTNPRLCSTAVLDIGHVINGEHAGADVDFWGVDIYSPTPGADYLRHDIFKATSKPFFLPEYGFTYQPAMCDSDTDCSKQEHEALQQMEWFSYENGKTGNEGAVFDQDAPVYSGGLLFEWNDEYWKAPASSPPCAPTEDSAQGWYGKNALRLKQGCPCVAPEQRSGACALDDLVPRPILSDPALLPSVWNTYIPSSYAPSTPPGPAPGPTPSPAVWEPCSPKTWSRGCCDPKSSPREVCWDGEECQECGGSPSCACPPEVVLRRANSTVVI